MDFKNNLTLIARIKARLAEPLPGLPVQLRMAPTFRQQDTHKHHYTKAGVLLLLYERKDGLSVVFMKRPEYEGVHGGQISFPGGKQELSDSSIEQTALRESHEEIGIDSNHVQILGKLTPLSIPVSKMEVDPVVGYIGNYQTFKTDAYEVDYLIETYLSDLLSPDIREVKPYTGKQYTGEIPYFNIRGNHIWGATAMMLNEFLEIVQPLI